MQSTPSLRVSAATRTGRWLSGLALVAALIPAAATAQSVMSQDEALRAAFPGADRFDRRTSFLSDEDAQAVSEMVGEKLEQRVITYYVAMSDAGPMGVAYFDAHRVRTLREALMVALDAEGKVRRIEVLSFAEPPEYAAPDGWLQLFEGMDAADPDRVRLAVPNVTGATLTSRAVKTAVGRTLALHELIAPMGSSVR